MAGFKDLTDDELLESYWNKRRERIILYRKIYRSDQDPKAYDPRVAKIRLEIAAYDDEFKVRGINIMDHPDPQKRRKK